MWRNRLPEITRKLTSMLRKLGLSDLGRIGSPILQDLGLRDPIASFGSTADLGDGVRDKLFDEHGALTPEIIAYLVELSESGGPSDPHALGPLCVSWAAILHLRDICNTTLE